MSYQCLRRLGIIITLLFQFCHRQNYLLAFQRGERYARLVITQKISPQLLFNISNEIYIFTYYHYLQTFASNQCGKTEAIIRCTVLTVSGVHTTTPAFAARNDFSATLLALVAPGISL